jgi:hypothetical protein
MDSNGLANRPTPPRRGLSSLRPPLPNRSSAHARPKLHRHLSPPPATSVTSMIHCNHETSAFTIQFMSLFAPHYGTQIQQRAKFVRVITMYYCSTLSYIYHHHTIARNRWLLTSTIAIILTRLLAVKLASAMGPASVRCAVPVMSGSTWCKCRVVLDYIRCVPHSVVIV